jgi:redox-sensitive bicupin YhaK (pirin superfamily)
VFVQVISGDIRVNGETLAAGDGAKLRDVNRVEIVAANDAEFLVFDLA